ncbi:hypothetical protein BCR39DRAFT_542512 [Naematelia encephala]|uniref:N-acetyltransferase domain-containing protein n=1 Tax=Naematelia encephala TaxID=71784 RepID=A0A1Y2AUM8_9TREE|nr:hypothetical protein BCR39DRAFT_542512 [Naematelia encephala]
MSYLNKYDTPTPTPIPADIHSQTPVSEYDQNFVFPVKVLRSDRVELRPFIPSEHATILQDGLNQDMLEWLPLELKPEGLYAFIEKSFRSNPAFLWHAIYTSLDPNPTPDQYEIAGTIGMINASVADQGAELGWIMILPKFQKTHTLTHAAGTMMHRILDSPTSGGLGLRRCQWFTNSLNDKSKSAALRLGFTHEGTLRAHRVLPLGKNGARDGREGEKQDLKSRDSWLASVIWTEWEGGVRDHVDKLMARR